jgi:cytochrome P450
VRRTPIRLDFHAADQHAENARLRKAGPVVLVELPDGVVAWATTRQDLLQQVLTDARIAKNASHWSAYQDGDVPPTWPLINFITVSGMTTADGDDHRRLRGLVSQAFTPRRVEALRPRIEQTTRQLLDAFPDTDDPVDLRAHFAYPLPMQVIGELLGIPTEMRHDFHRLSTAGVSTVINPDDVIATQRQLYALLARIVAIKRENPADDLTSALIAVRDHDDRLSEAELAGTMLTIIHAGHKTTLSLIINATRALLTHLDQLALVRTGAQTWSDVIEETLRWDGPLGQFPLRYATQDLELGGTTIRKGEAILASYAAVGRDPARYGEDADRFDVTRAGARHISFGIGAHYCLGASLARLEAEVALPALFERFPHLALAEAPEHLKPIPSLVSNTVEALPVTTRRRARGRATAIAAAAGGR